MTYFVDQILNPKITFFGTEGILTIQLRGDQTT
jgi:hypothetical protein